MDKGNDETIIKTQYVSYLLGFGPTWEAYAYNAGQRFRQKLNQEQDRKETWIFSPLHYQELSHGLKATNQQNISGRDYSLNIRPLQRGIKQNKLINELTKALHWDQVADPLSLQTPYIQASLYYRHNLVQITSSLLPNEPLSTEALALFQRLRICSKSSIR